MLLCLPSMSNAIDYLRENPQHKSVQSASHSPNNSQYVALMSMVSVFTVPDSRGSDPHTLRTTVSASSLRQLGFFIPIQPTRFASSQAGIQARGVSEAVAQKVHAPTNENRPKRFMIHVGHISHGGVRPEVKIPGRVLRRWLLIFCYIFLKKNDYISGDDYQLSPPHFIGIIYGQ